MQDGDSHFRTVFSDLREPDTLVQPFATEPVISVLNGTVGGRMRMQKRSNDFSIRQQTTNNVLQRSLSL